MARGESPNICRDIVPTIYIARQFRSIDYGVGPDGRKIITIKSDVEDTDGWSLAFEICNLVGHPLGQRHAAPAYADQVKIARAMILFNDLRGKPRERTIDPRPIHNACLFYKIHWRWILTRSVTGDKGMQAVMSDK
jgi:hypothetical protein